MRKLSLVLAFAALVALFHAAPASAQATRTWVSGVGDDANPCSRTAPCKTFAGAISKTAAGGEISVLDPGGYGAVTITKAITINGGDGMVTGVMVSGTNGIVVSAAVGDKVVLEGLTIEGIGTGLSGVRITSAGNVTIRNTTIKNFLTAGVNVLGTAATRVLIENSLITNSTVGVNCDWTSGAGSTVLVVRSTLDLNSTASVNSVGSSRVFLNGATLTGTATAIQTSGGGQVISAGNNFLRGAGLPTQTTGLQ